MLFRTCFQRQQWSYNGLCQLELLTDPVSSTCCRMLVHKPLDHLGSSVPIFVAIVVLSRCSVWNSWDRVLSASIKTYVWAWRSRRHMTPFLSSAPNFPKSVTQTWPKVRNGLTCLVSHRRLIPGWNTRPRSGQRRVWLLSYHPPHLRLSHCQWTF